MREPTQSKIHISMLDTATKRKAFDELQVVRTRLWEASGAAWMLKTRLRATQRRLIAIVFGEASKKP